MNKYYKPKYSHRQLEIIRFSLGVVIDELKTTKEATTPSGKKLIEEYNVIKEKTERLLFYVSNTRTKKKI